MIDGRDAHVARCLVLQADIDVGRGIVADEHRCEADPAELRDVARDLFANSRCERLAVHRSRRHGAGNYRSNLPLSSSAMDTAQLPEAPRPIRHEGIFLYYELAKRAEWRVRDLPWDGQPAVPETRGAAEKQARRRDIWRSVIMQQLQADQFAVQMAAQLFSAAPHFEAKLYYSTMVQDESLHTEAWLKLTELVGGEGERDPYLDELAAMFLALDTLEEKVFLMQVFFERLIIPRFRMIARASRGTVLEDVCNRLTIDDGIHHSSGVAYERVLLEGASKKTKERLVKTANQLLPIFVDHALWRPKERAWIGTVMRETDIRRLQEDVMDGIRMASSLGLDVSEIELPFAA